MEKPNKENFIEVMHFLKMSCKEPKDRHCEDCPLYANNIMNGCLLATWPEYWDIDKIVENIYERS